MLKFKITKAAYDALPDAIKSEYETGEGDNEFVLSIDGLPAPEDTGPLKRSLQNEKDRHKTTKAELDAAKAKIAEFPDVDALKTTHEAEVGKYKSFTEATLRDGKAMELATKISTVPALFAKTIAERIVVDMSGDTPVAKIKGPDGKVGDMTFDDLSKELVANKEYAGIMIGSKASGGAAPKTPAKPLGGAAPKGEQGGDKPANLGTLGGSDLVASLNARKAAREEAASA